MAVSCIVFTQRHCLVLHDELWFLHPALVAPAKMTQQHPTRKADPGSRKILDFMEIEGALR